TVVSSSASELVISTPSGQQRYIVDTNTSIPSDLAAGTRVTVEFHRLDGNRRHAARVTTPPRADTRPRADASAPLTDPDRGGAGDRSRPATSSTLAVTGVLGFLSLAGAATLRVCRRRF